MIPGMIDDLVRRLAETHDDDMALLDQLEHDAAKDPEAMRPYLANLLEHGTTWPPGLYRRPASRPPP
jgi:hypothetical protein